MRENVSYMDRRISSWRGSSTFPSPFYVLLLFGVQLIADVLRHIVVTLQLATLLYEVDQLPQVVRLQPVISLANVVPPAVRS
jgi:hypothetical protein